MGAACDLSSTGFLFLPRSLGPILVATACVRIFLGGLGAQAQTFDASNLRVPVDLGAKWLIHAGDDPAYARADFDDSQWTLFDPSTSITNLFPQNKPTVIWYRLHVKVDPAQTGLALKEYEIGRAFEIYVNGEKLIESGRVSPFGPYSEDARLVRRIPDRMLATGTLLIALRVHISSIDWTAQNPGFDSSNLSIGQQSILYRDDWLSIIGQNALEWLGQLLLISRPGGCGALHFTAPPNRIFVDIRSGRAYRSAIADAHHPQVPRHPHGLGGCSGHAPDFPTLCLGLIVFLVCASTHWLAVAGVSSVHWNPVHT